MIFKKLFSFLKGYVLFETEGIMCEELISRCIKKDIVLSRIKTTRFGFQAEAKIDNYREIADISRKLGMRTHIIKKYGVRFVLFRNKKRYGILIGIILFVLINSFFGSRLWRIEIKGNDKISDEIILSQLSENGVYIGSVTKDVDALSLERTLLCEIEGISCIVLNFQGTSLEVIVNEIHNEKYLIDDDKKKYNIVASQSGQITYTEVYDGVAVVEKGQAVQKGDLLISGVKEGKRGFLHLNSAGGKVMALVEETIEEKVDFAQTDYVFTGKSSTVRFIKIGGKKIRLSFMRNPKQQYYYDEKAKKLSLFGVNMPISVGIEMYSYIEPVEVTLSREEAKNICLKNLQDEEVNRFRDCKIVEKQLVSKVEVGAYHIICRYLVEKDIGEKLEYFAEE